MMNDTQHDSSNIHVAAATAYRLLYTNVFTCCNHIGITLYIYLSLSVVTEIFETRPDVQVVTLLLLLLPAIALR